jgi:hypothetical protein
MRAVGRNHTRRYRLQSDHGSQYGDDAGVFARAKAQGEEPHERD